LEPEWRAEFEAAFPEHKAALPPIDAESLRPYGGRRLFGAIVRQRDAAAVRGAIEELRAAAVVPSEVGTKRGHSSFPSIGSEKNECPLLLSLDDLSEDVVAGVEHFFVAYGEMEQKRFKPLSRHGPDRALALVREAQRDYGPDKSGGKKRGKARKDGKS
jgi:hypothetical protein